MHSLAHADVVIPAHLENIDGVPFLLMTDGQGEDAILVFGPRNALQNLVDLQMLMIEGTFKVTPRLLTQLFTIYTVIKGHVVFIR